MNRDETLALRQPECQGEQDYLRKIIASNLSSGESAMTPQEIFDILNSRFVDCGVEFFPQTQEGGDAFIRIAPESLVEVCQFLKMDPGMDFKLLHCLSGVDYGDHLSSVIHLFSLTHRHWLTVKAECPKDNPVLPSLATVWKAANWHEREAYDLLGIQYEGHPNLRRILLPDDWEGHPLRKDYQMPDDSMYPWESDSPPESGSGHPDPARPTAPGSESQPLQRPTTGS